MRIDEGNDNLFGVDKESIQALRHENAKLRRRVEYLTKLFYREVADKTQAKTFETTIKREQASSSSKLEQVSPSSTALASRNEQLKAQLVEVRAKLKERVEDLVGKLQAVREIYSVAKEFYPLYRKGYFASQIGEQGEHLKAECYVSLLPSTLPAAFEMQRRFGGRVICDNVENVDVEKQSAAPTWSPVALRMVNHAAHGALFDCDGLLTVSDALEKTLRRFGRPTLVVKNFREHHVPVPDDSFRDKCGLAPSDILLFASGNVVIGFEPVLRALSQLPPTFHLAALIQLRPKEYENEIRSLVKDLGLEKRVHFFPFVPYNQLASIAASADIGLITSDTANPNAAIGLPNRCFDYLTAGLPVVGPPMPDVKALVEEFGFGRILEIVSADEWKKMILDAFEHRDEIRERARLAREALTWESQEDALYEFLGSPKSVTLLSFRDLTIYQRYQRLGRTLLKKGVDVKFMFYSEVPNVANMIDGIEYYCTGDRYGVGKGIQRLEHAH